MPKYLFMLSPSDDYTTRLGPFSNDGEKNRAIAAMALNTLAIEKETGYPMELQTDIECDSHSVVLSFAEKEFKSGYQNAECYLFEEKYIPILEYQGNPLANYCGCLGPLGDEVVKLDIAQGVQDLRDYIAKCVAAREPGPLENIPLETLEAEILRRKRGKV